MDSEGFQSRATQGAYSQLTFTEDGSDVSKGDLRSPTPQNGSTANPNCLLPSIAGATTPVSGAPVVRTSVSNIRSGIARTTSGNPAQAEHCSAPAVPRKQRVRGFAISSYVCICTSVTSMERCEPGHSGLMRSVTLALIETVGVRGRQRFVANCFFLSSPSLFHLVASCLLWLAGNSELAQSG